MTAGPADAHVVGFAGRRLHVVDEDPDFPLSDPVRLTREPERYALGQLLLVAVGDAGPAAPLGPAELADIGGIRRVDGTTPDYGCLAVPLRDASGAIAGGLAFSGPRHRILDAPDLVSRLTPVAERLAPYVT